MRVQRGRKRQATATITPYQQQVLSAIAKEENEHERFLLSFAPTLARRGAFWRPCDGSAVDVPVDDLAVLAPILKAKAMDRNESPVARHLPKE
ncbi:unnamed protein product [Boreogadus saida]